MRPCCAASPLQVRCLLRVSIYHVSFLRGLFPDSMFSGATMNNLGAPARQHAWRTQPAALRLAGARSGGHMHSQRTHAERLPAAPLARMPPRLLLLMRAGGFTVKMLGGEGVQLSDDAQAMKDWVEKGEQGSNGRQAHACAARAAAAGHGTTAERLQPPSPHQP